MVVLEVVEELLKDTSSVLKCSEHSKRESVILCADCLEGLCVKCMKETRKTSNSHHEHQLEELDDAKSQLWQKYEMQVKAKQLNLQEKISLINKSAFSVVEITKAKSDINDLWHKIESIMKNWKEVQLTQIGVFKEEATKREDKTHGEAAKLQSVLQKQDIAIGTLISELKQGDCQWNIEVHNMPASNQYKFREHQEELVATLISELSSEKSLNSKLLKPEQIRDNRSDEVLKGTKSPTNSTDSKSDDSKHDSKDRKTSLDSRNKDSTQKKDIYFGSISNVWNYGKEFIFC